MTNQDIYQLMDRFEGSTLQSMKLSTGDFNIELTRTNSGSAVSPISPVSAPAPAPVKQEEPTINAPLVGTFYAAPGPDQAPFVSVGDRVSKGQPVCLMEAMKMMSEIPAPCDCIIEAVLKANGELASFQEPLFRYRAV